MTNTCESMRAPRTLPCFDVQAIIDLAKSRSIEILHVDAQGVELPFIKSIIKAVENRMVRFVLVSTHHSSISGSPTTHEDCLATIGSFGGRVLVEHSVQESFSGDGLIVASFLPHDRSLELPAISRNDPSESLFPLP